MPSGAGHKAYIKRLEQDKQERGSDEFIEFDFDLKEMGTKVAVEV